MSTEPPYIWDYSTLQTFTKTKDMSCISSMLTRSKSIAKVTIFTGSSRTSCIIDSSELDDLLSIFEYGESFVKNKE